MSQFIDPISASRYPLKFLPLPEYAFFLFGIEFYSIKLRIKFFNDRWIFERGSIHFFTPSTPIRIHVYKYFPGLFFNGFCSFLPGHPIDLLAGGALGKD